LSEALSALKFWQIALSVTADAIGIKRKPSPAEKHRQASTPTNRVIRAQLLLTACCLLLIRNLLITYQRCRYLGNSSSLPVVGGKRKSNA
jgi:hypothetical protein